MDGVGGDTRIPPPRLDRGHPGALGGAPNVQAAAPRAKHALARTANPQFQYSRCCRL